MNVSNENWKESLYKSALKKWGTNNQLDMVIEECSELTKATCKLKRGNKPESILMEEFVDELADVEIMIEQMKSCFSLHLAVSSKKQEKLLRLEERLK